MATAGAAHILLQNHSLGIVRTTPWRAGLRIKESGHFLKLIYSFKTLLWALETCEGHFSSVLSTDDRFQRYYSSPLNFQSFPVVYLLPSSMRAAGIWIWSDVCHILNHLSFSWERKSDTEIRLSTEWKQEINVSVWDTGVSMPSKRTESYLDTQLRADITLEREKWVSLPIRKWKSKNNRGLFQVP